MVLVKGCSHCLGKNVLNLTDRYFRKWFHIWIGLIIWVVLQRGSTVFIVPDFHSIVYSQFQIYHSFTIFVFSFSYAEAYRTRALESQSVKDQLFSLYTLVVKKLLTSPVKKLLNRAKVNLLVKLHKMQHLP